ncbi:Uncharacterised protein g3591 [Pycnogonum litorale]
MATSDASVLLSAVKWADESLSLQEFVQRIPLPQVAKIIKGQYKTLGVPTLPNPSLNQTVFVSNIGKRLKVVAQCVKFKDGKRVVPVGPIIAIPEMFNGWFEILSEDGRAMKCIESVAELVKRFPDTCIVRENIKAFVPNTNSDSGKISDKTRVVHGGERLVLVSEVSGSHFQKVKSQQNAANKFLRCFDANGESVYFSLEQKGKFSPVAGEDNISGVHSIKNLIRKRMPITVKFVTGKIPHGVLKNVPNHCSPEMRLLGVVEEECTLAMPLLKDLTNVVTVPMCASLKLLAPRNNDELRKLREYARLSERCKYLGRDSVDKIHVLDMSSKSKDVLQIRNSYSRYGGHSNIHQYFGNIHNQIRKFNNSEPKSTKDHRKRSSSVAEEVKEGNDDRSKATLNEDNDPRYDEIDIIYDYVRGFGPLPKNISNEFDKNNESFLANKSQRKISHSSRSQSKSIQVNQVTTQSKQSTVNKLPAVPKSPVTTSPPVVNRSPVAPVKKVPLDKSISERKHQHPAVQVELIPTVPKSPKEKKSIKTSSLPTKPDGADKLPEEKPPEPPPIETIPVRRSVSMPNATAPNIVSNAESIPQQDSKGSPKQHKLNSVRSQNRHPQETSRIAMTDNVAYSNFKQQQNKDNVYDMITHEHEPFTVDLKSPDSLAASRGHHRKHSSTNNKINCKLFMKSHTPNKSQRPRLFKHSFSSPAGDVGIAVPHHRPQVKSKQGTTKVNPTPSPIFNMRYKSLTDLALDFDTLDSSNSGGHISEGSAGSNSNDLYIQHKPNEEIGGKLPRPRSLTNLVWPANEADCINNNNNNVKQCNKIMSNLFHNNMNKSNKKSGNNRKLSDGVLIYGKNGNVSQAHKRLSALYL